MTTSPIRATACSRAASIDLDGLQTVPGETFRWKGEYGFDMNSRETIYTKLNVFEQFEPVIPEAYHASPFVFLGNIHPRLQLDVLDQVKQPKLVAADTMDFWIEGTPDELRKVLKRIDVLIINDSEARELSGEANLVKAARALQGHGAVHGGHQARRARCAHHLHRRERVLCGARHAAGGGLRPHRCR